MTFTCVVGGVKISNINLITPRRRIRYANPEFHVKINFTGESETKMKTERKSLDGDRVIWNESFSFAGDIDDSVVTFQVFKTHLLHLKLVGTLKKEVAELILLRSDCGLCTLDMGGKSQITFNIELQSGLLPSVVAQASEAANVISSAHNKLFNRTDTWWSFVSKFQIFLEIVDKIVEIHPWATLAWNIIAVIPKTILSFKDRNESVQQLCEKLKETYDFFTDVERLPRLNETQVSILSMLVHQTVECGYFIREYSKGNIVEKIWKGARLDDKIKAFIDKFDQIQKAVAHSTILETNITTLRVSGTINEIKELTLLSEMPYARDAGFISKKRCLAGTRQNLIQEIMDWVNDDTAKQILVLSGAAGTGKSAIAHTIAEIFSKQNRLGSLFCFSRSYKDRCNYLFSTISRGLADTDDLWRKALTKIIEKSAIRTSTDIETQFEELIVKPSKETAVIGPVVIVIDALDESGDREEREALLDILFSRLPELPTNYRILLTTRPETDIEPRCQCSTVVYKRMGDIAADGTLSDIRSYVSFRLRNIAKTLDEIQSDWRDVLAKRSEGLFQWAETVCRFIDPTVHKPSLVRKRWKACGSGSSTSLYELYHGIISSQQESRDSEFIDDFKKVISAIMAAREPLTIHALENIFQGIIEDVQMTLEPFGSLLLGVHESFTLVRPLHTSLFDFFHSQSQGEAKNENQYYVDTSDQSVFALGCLRTLTRTLHFNICNLETSHRRNRDIPDLDARVKKVIPLELSYACRFWAFHLRDSRDSTCLVPELRILMHEKILFLFETLSLLKGVEEGCVAMRIMGSWCKDVDDELAKEAWEACQFGVDFGEMMAESTPHLYLSALPFTPSDSFISKHFLPKYPQLFNIEVGQSLGSPTKTGLVKRKNPPSSVRLVVFSPQNKHIANAFFDGTLWIWDYETGEMICEWKSRDSQISNIVFSPDGRLVYWCFDDASIQIFNVWTKEATDESYQKVRDDELCQKVHGDESESESEDLEWPWCTISSDSRYIAFSAGDKLVLYDRETRRKLTQFEYWSSQSFSIFQPVFSPNGNMFAFPVHVSNGDELWLWNTRKQALGPRMKLPERVETFALSDKQVAFGSRGMETEVWDIATLTKVRTIPVNCSSVCFINDGCLAIESDDEGYSIWNASTGERIVVIPVFNTCSSIGASHESKLIALSADDGAVHIRQWDGEVKSKTSDGVMNFDPADLWVRGRYLIQCHDAQDHYLLRISDIRSVNNIVFEARYLSHYVNVAVSPSNFDERVYVAYCTGARIQKLRLWSDVEGEFILDEGKEITPRRFSTAGDRLISHHGDDTFKIWDTSTRTLIGGPYTINLGRVCTCAFSASNDNLFIASRTPNGKTVIYIQECQSNRVSRGSFEISRSPSMITSSADDTRIICLSGSHIDILDAQTGKKELSLSRYKLIPQVSPNRKYAAWFLNKNEIMVWDINHGVQLQILSVDGNLYPFCFSEDSAQILALYSTDDGKYHCDIWDVSTGKRTCRVIGIYFAREHRPILFSDGNYLAFSPGLNHVPIILDLNVHKILSLLYEHHREHSRFGMLPMETRQAIQDLHGSTSENKEILEYALIAWNKALFSRAFQRKDSNGWMLGPHGELLFWVPENRRSALWYPCITHVAANDFTKLNFDRFVHGFRWTECKKTS